MSKAKQITMAEDLWRSLDELGRELGYTDPRGSRSQLVREMVSASVTKWRESPYVCRSARHVALVTANGDVFYRTLQILKLNSRRERLPCVLEMKPEKRRDFLHNRDPQVPEADWFRSRWLLNYFAVWHGEARSGPPLSSLADRDGTDMKMADLTINMGSGRVLTREMIVGIKDYVQWQTENERREFRDQPLLYGGYDRIDIAIDIPTRNLEIIVAVDTALYSDSLDTESELANLQVEFRNREGARFKGRAAAWDKENPMHVLPGRKLDDFGDPDAEQIESEIGALHRRILDLCNATATDSLHLTDDEKKILRKTLKRPQHFLYYNLRWPSPYFGIEVCVRWEKPVKAVSTPAAKRRQATARKKQRA